MKGLKFFARTSDPARINLASWHSPHSLTWRWIVAWARFKGDERRAHWRLIRNNNGIQLHLLVPWIGRLELHTQRPMWYRDLRSSRDEEHDLRTSRHRAAIVAEAVNERGDRPLH